MQKALSNVMGDTNILGPTITVQSSFELKEDTSTIPNFVDILVSNPYIKSLEMQKESEGFKLALESIKILPSVSVSASVSQNDNTFLSNNELSRTVGINLSVPIFAGNIRKDKIKNAGSSYFQAVLNIENTKNNILNSLETSWINLQESLFDVTTKNKFLEASKKRSEITRAKYSIGLVSFDDWIIIEDNLISVTKARLDAEIQTLKRETEWIQAKGGTLDYE